MEYNRSKVVEVSLICYFVLSIIFWIALFKLSPNYVEFAVTKGQIEKMHIPENRKVYIYELNAKTFSKDYERIKQAENTQDIIGGILTAYAISGLLIFLLLDKKFLHKLYLPLLLILFVAIFITSNAYYNYIFAPFVGKVDNFDKHFIIIKALPTTIISYVVFRKIFVLFTSEEPKIVGKIALFTDPVNWLFTVFVFLGGFVAGNFIPWFK